MESTMNRFVLKPNPKPEFKMAQPLPAFFGIPTVKRESAGATEAVSLRPGIQPGFSAAAKTEPFTTAVRNMLS
jgi:hypothetical protein